VDFYIVLTAELERVLFNYKSWHFSEIVCGDWRVIFVKVFVCPAYCSYTLFLSVDTRMLVFSLLSFQ